MGAGTYVVAVSGGVDSMVLLDVLRQRPGLKLVVAHYDHGMRLGSAADRQLVQDVSHRHGLQFVHEAGHLGTGTSEAKARVARYRFLRSVQAASGARAIITAHHQDDVLETAIMNLLRGSGRRGLTSLKSQADLLRPLLPYSKEQLRDYARAHHLEWHEDPTNADTAYQRNYVRLNILPKFSDGQRAQLLILLEQAAERNDELETHLTSLLHTQPALDTLKRAWFIRLPHAVAQEVVHTWLRRHGVRDVTRKMVERLVVKMKTARASQQIDVDRQHVLDIRRDSLHLRSRAAIGTRLA